MQKKKIIHFIFDLGRGGAETMLVRVLQELTEFENVVVTFIPMNHFGEELKCDKLICLNMKSLLMLPLIVFRFRKIVKAENPDIVHTHLFWPTVIGRLAVPSRIPLITTIHAFIATSVEYKQWHIRFLDKLTYRFRKSVIVVVARGALKEYFSFLRLKPWKSYALYTFVDIGRFNNKQLPPPVSSPVFRVISVGALRRQKNYSYLVEAFSRIKDKPIELHIYGRGDLEESLRRQIETSGARVVLKGQHKEIEQIIPQYDLYVMSSSFEGFSLSVLEAMAMGMPLLLSDIPSFREQAEGIAGFFPLNDPDQLVKQLVAFSQKPAAELKAMGERARQKAVNEFTLEKHMEGLRAIYAETLAGQAG